MEQRKASFSVEISTQHSSSHNDRTNPPKYLLGLKPDTQNYYQKMNGYENDTQFVIKMSQKYQKVFGQKMQQKQKESMIKEAVISLNKRHSAYNVLNLFQKLEEVFGGHIPLELSIHRDEGYYMRDGITYYPSKHIVKKEDGWYTINDDPNYDYDDEETQFPSYFFDNLVDISEFTPVYNYHAHVKFTMINLNGAIPSFEDNDSLPEENFSSEQAKYRTAKMQKKHMQARLKIVANELDMRYAPSPKSSRIKRSISQAKDDHEYQRQLNIEKEKYEKRIKILSDKIVQSNEYMDQYEVLLEEKEKHIIKLQRQLDEAKSESASSSTIDKLRPHIKHLQVQITERDAHIKVLENLSFIRDEDGAFETYEEEDGEIYYKTFKEENEKLENWKDKAVIFIKKISSFFGFSDNIKDANEELNILIKEDQKENYSSKQDHPTIDDFAEGRSI